MKSAAATTITCVEPALTMAMWQYSTSKYVARTSDPWGNRLRFVGDRSAHINRHEAALTSKRLDSFVLHGKCSGCCCCLGNPHRAAWAHICFCPRLGFRQRRRRVYIRTTCNFAFINFNFLLFFVVVVSNSINFIVCEINTNRLQWHWQCRRRYWCARAVQCPRDACNTLCLPLNCLRLRCECACQRHTTSYDLAVVRPQKGFVRFFMGERQIKAPKVQVH